MNVLEQIAKHSSISALDNVSVYKLDIHDTMWKYEQLTTVEVEEIHKTSWMCKKFKTQGKCRISQGKVWSILNTMESVNNLPYN